MPGSDLIRKKIRDTAQSLLIAAPTDAGGNVFVRRINKAFIEELPGIYIYTISDTPVITKKYEVTFDRSILLITEIVVSQINAVDNPQDRADIIAGQVEDTLLPNVYLQDPVPWGVPTPGPQIIDEIHLGPTNVSRVDELQEDLYGLIIEFECICHYTQLTPTGVLADFNRFEEKFDIDGEEATRLTEIPPTP